MKSIGVIGLGKTGIAICKQIRNEFGSDIKLKGLYKEVLLYKNECVDLSIDAYSYSSIHSFINNLDVIICTVNKNWYEITKEVFNYISSNSFLIFISSTGVYGDRKGIVVNEKTSLKPSIVKDYLKELINAEELVLSRSKSYIMRCGLLFDNKKELITYISVINKSQGHKYINITQREFLCKYICVLLKDVMVKNKVKGSVCNVVSKSILLNDLLIELDIKKNNKGICSLITNVQIDISKVLKELNISEQD